MLRSAFASVTVIVLTIVFGVPATILSLLHPKGDWVIRLGRIWARGICAASGVTIEDRGTRMLPQGRPFLLISNHLSHFDLLAILLSFPGSFRVVAKRLLFFIPVFGWCLWASGMIPIDRKSRASAIDSLDRAAKRARTGQPVLFFAEGTRSRDGRMQPFKKGAFVIAVKSGIPIVPVSVRGSYEVLRKGSVRIRPGRIVVRYGREIPVDGYTMETKDRLIAQVHAAVRDGLGESATARAAPVSGGAATSSS